MGEYIRRQEGEEIKNIPWGIFSTIGKTGCGVVAAYNAGKALGRDPEFLQIVREMEKSHMPTLGGVFGTNVFRLKFWLQKKFGRAHLYFLNTEEWERETRSCHASIIFYKNKGVFKGNHFICGVRLEEKFVFYNCGVLPSEESISMDSALQQIRKAGHTPIFLITV